MNWLKRMAAMVLTAVVFLQCAALPVSAAVGSMVGFSGSREIVLINITSDSNQKTDFVLKLPKSLSVKEETMEFPTQEWEVFPHRDYDSIPMYFQSDYPDALYGSGTVETCGSGITALAMVATYLTGYEYLPDELARCFAGKADEDVARLTYGSKALELPYKTTEDWTTVFEALKAGKPVIIQLDRLSVFTDSEEMDAQHFVILTGITTEGKILVQDPCGSHYIAEELKEGFLTGFSEEDVSTGFRYGWIYDKSAVPKNIARYADTEKPAATNRYRKLKLTPAEKQLLARAVYVLGHGECAEGQQAMVEVILNRLLSSEYPDELREILFGDEPMCDMARLNEAQLTSVQYRIVERALEGPYILTTTKATDFSYQCHK